MPISTDHIDALARWIEQRAHAASAKRDHLTIERMATQLDCLCTLAAIAGDMTRFNALAASAQAMWSTYRDITGAKKRRRSDQWKP